MLSAYVRRRKLTAALCALAGVTATWLLFSCTFGSGQSEKLPHGGHPELAHSDYFETYVNYTGPQPIPGPIDIPSPFRFLINEPEACSQQRHPDMRLLYYVHSSPQHFQQRKFIRRAWASPRFYSQFRMATVFFLGRTDNEQLQQLVEKESRKFKDIIQTDWPDNYYNLTFKAVSALAWVSQYCSQVEYVLKTDDDVFVNVFRLMELLSGNATRGDAIHCSVYANGAPHRNPQSKWFVRPGEYPWRKYPDFCAGMAVYYAGHLVPKLFAATPHVPYLKLDDVYVTGLLRRHAQIGIKDLGSAVNIFSGNTCLQKGAKSEVFCHVDSSRLKSDLWLQLMMMEIKERARGNEDVRQEFMEALTNILE